LSIIQIDSIFISLHQVIFFSPLPKGEGGKFQCENRKHKNLGCQIRQLYNEPSEDYVA